MRIIDSHCHVYPQAIAAKAVKGVSEFYDGVGDSCDGLASTVKEDWKKKGVDHAIIFSVATTLHQVDSINRFIAKTVAESDGFFTGLGAMYQDYPDMGEAVKTMVSMGLKGVKMHLEMQGCAIDDPRLLALYEACANTIPVYLHTGDKRYDYSNPNRLKRVLKMFPHTTFIGAHFGGWSIWEEATRELHGFDNLYVDSSSTFHWVEHSKVKDYIRAYGSDRVMFGSDFPMWDVEHEIRYMLELKLTDEEYENVFHKTAERVFDI